jgi:hypothetical protein
MPLSRQALPLLHLSVIYTRFFRIVSQPIAIYDHLETSDVLVASRFILGLELNMHPSF